ncbi:hypothetical protein AVEN_257717-1 [Araneus ventricosus]|uniref:Uncharacterized protein n=1 Tax=Araneus ventricosus TaxID=182803 RepID=A0A4Y2LET9_ARAVE|nr:hypothetical protein AVEN_257717-1 [Araneus ventricosus]
MKFLERIQKFLCHDSSLMSIVARPNQCPCIRCEECQTDPIPNVYAFIYKVSEENIWEACELAQQYYDLTGDGNVPIPFVLLSVEGILDKRIEGQPLKRLHDAVRILRAINAPFTQDDPVEPPKDVMDNFMDDYMNALSLAKKCDKDLKGKEQLILKQLLTHLHQVLESDDFQENKFEFYFQKLVPYVKFCKKDWTPLPASKPESNLIKQLLQELQRSQAIRKMFSQYCIPFDIYHVLMGCYVSCSDIEMVANWALDFIARVCKGEFFWKKYQNCAFVEQILHLLNTDVSYKKNTDLYYVKRALQNGDGIESLSENFNKYLQLEKFIKEKIQAPGEFKDLICHNLFPSILFETHDMQIAFMIGMGHVASNVDMKTGKVRKGVFAKARKLYNIIKNLVGQVEKFDAQYTIPWTIDTFKLFLVSDCNVDKDLTEISKVVFQQEETTEED